MGSPGNTRCGVLSGIFGSLVTLGIGIVIGLYAIGESSVLQFLAVGDRISMLVTSFECWYATMYKDIRCWG